MNLNKIIFSRLYHKTTLLAQIYRNWYWNTLEYVTPPDFVLESRKKICVYALKDDDHSDDDDEYATNAAAISLNRFAHKISSIKVNSVYLMTNVKCMKPAEFPHLTSLDLEAVDFDDDSLIMLAPQLESLRLVKIWKRFDISSIDEESKSFTKLKILKIEYVQIDVKKILTKCCNSLKYLVLESGKWDLDEFRFDSGIWHLEDLEKELPNLINLYVRVNKNLPVESVRHLLTKCSVSLRTLSFHSDVTIDLSTLLKQTMKITTLEANFRSVDGLEILLSKCPLVQKLSIKNYYQEVKELVLKDLTYLELFWCGSQFMTSFLNQANKSSLNTVHIRQESEVLNECKIPVISKMDKLVVTPGDYFT